MDMFYCAQFAFIVAALFVSSLCMNPNLSNNHEDYGPYTLDWDSSGLCKGPKSVNSTQVSYDLNNGKGICILNLTFPDATQINEIKVMVFTEKKGSKVLLWNYRIKDPCRNIMVASMIKHHLNTDNCIVKKGFYSCRLNFHDTTSTFLGNAFFYGSFIFKSIVMSKSSNIFCFITTVSFTKRC